MAMYKKQEGKIQHIITGSTDTKLQAFFSQFWGFGTVAALPFDGSSGTDDRLLVIVLLRLRGSGISSNGSWFEEFDFVLMLVKI